MFGDLVCVDLFSLSDVDENQWSFLNAVDKVSGYQLCAPVRSKRPDEVLKVFTRRWSTPFGIPHNVLADGGGEFEREFGENLKNMVQPSSKQLPILQHKTARQREEEEHGRPMPKQPCLKHAIASAQRNRLSSSAQPLIMR